MEYGWERTFPFLDIDRKVIIELFNGVLEKKDIVNIVPVDEGCRTTNYFVETNLARNKYILKIFFQNEQNHKREVELLIKLKDSKMLPVPKIYKFGKHDAIKGREYIIYQYLDGKTIGQTLREGKTLSEQFIRETARALTVIHSIKFDRAGVLDEKLKVMKELPPLVSWYKECIGYRAKIRLGENRIKNIYYAVEQNKKVLMKLDNDIRLIHGDFQGTNILIKNDKIAGILDWELAMAGYPLSDIGQFFRYDECFDKELMAIFEEEYNKKSSYKLIDDWYRISKILDLINLIKLIDTEEDMPNKHRNIKNIIDDILKMF